MNDTHYNLTASPLRTGIQGKCPRCQKGRIFSGYLKVAPACDVCGQSFGFSDTADGPAFFAMSIVSPFSVALALWLEFTYHAPIWVQVVATGGFTVAGCLYFLRPLKGWLLCSQYVHLVREGKLKSDSFNQSKL